MLPLVLLLLLLPMMLLNAKWIEIDDHNFKINGLTKVNRTFPHNQLKLCKMDLF